MSIKGKHRVNNSCYGKHKVKKKIIGPLQNLLSFILLSLWTHTIRGDVPQPTRFETLQTIFEYLPQES
jgi:hypothetical protein